MQTQTTNNHINNRQTTDPAIFKLPSIIIEYKYGYLYAKNRYRWS